MKTLLSETFAPTTSAIGFIHRPLDEVAVKMESWRRSLYPRVTAIRTNEGFPDVLRRLEPLTSGARPREVLVRLGPSWTAYFDCSHKGTDAVSATHVLSRQLDCQGLAINVVPDSPSSTERPNPGRLGAIQFELMSPQPVGPVKSVRSISLTKDSRWEFELHGTPQPFEELEMYSHKSVRDRFTSEMLERYCKAVGVDVFNPDAYGPDAVLFESDVPMPPRFAELTFSEAQEQLGIVPGGADRLPG